MDIYLEVGRKNVFAGALDWPGWCRSGREEPAALEALLAIGPRYARVPQIAGVAFRPARTVRGLVVAERLPGNSATDFGAPGAVPAGDAQPLTGKTLERWQALLEASWQAFAEALAGAEGRALRTGPRGGGRDQAGIAGHVLESHRGYLSTLGWPVKLPAGLRWPDALAVLRAADSDGLRAASRGELPTRGPRGGARWPARYFIRRAAWHILDHAWEIEDRLLD